MVCTSEENITWLWPATTSIIAGPPPLNGTCRNFTPVCSSNSAPPRCWKLPTPAEAQPILPGDFFASAIRSFTLFACTPGLTTITFGPEASAAIGVNDLMGS